MLVLVVTQCYWVTAELKSKKLPCLPADIYREAQIYDKDIMTIKDENVSVLHENRELLGNPSPTPKGFPETRGSREISRVEGMDFPLPPEITIWFNFLP